MYVRKQCEHRNSRKKTKVLTLRIVNVDMQTQKLVLFLNLLKALNIWNNLVILRIQSGIYVIGKRYHLTY